MKRRDILKGVGMAAAAAGLAACGKAGPGTGTAVADEGPRQWKMVTSWPTNFPGLAPAPRASPSASRRRRAAASR